MGTLLLRPWILVMCCASALAEPAPFADIHIHFNWDQKELITAGEVVDRLKAENVVVAVVSGTPSTLALELQQAAGKWMVPLFSPYIHELGRRDWHRRDEVLAQARAGLASGAYQGIGEVHFMDGFPPAMDKPIFQGLLELATEFDVPVLIHIDASRPDPLTRACEEHPEVRFLFAHAGGKLTPEQVAEILGRCKNVWVEFSAKDPWRYGGLTSPDGQLLPAWRSLVLAHPTRFMTGTDPVWGVTRTQRWDQADEGWDHFSELLAYHRQWLAGLPSQVAEQVRLKNALQFFRIDQP